MSKPNWDDAPEWATHMAQDQDGDWYWYEFEPHLKDGRWAYVGWADKADIDAKEWKSTKERRP